MPPYSSAGRGGERNASHNAVSGDTLHSDARRNWGKRLTQNRCEQGDNAAWKGRAKRKRSTVHQAGSRACIGQVRNDTRGACQWKTGSSNPQSWHNGLAQAWTGSIVIGKTYLAQSNFRLDSCGSPRKGLKGTLREDSGRKCSTIGREKIPGHVYKRNSIWWIKFYYKGKSYRKSAKTAFPIPWRSGNRYMQRIPGRYDLYEGNFR